MALLGADRIKASLKSVENMFQWRTFQSTIWLVTSFMAISLLVYFRSELFMNYASRFFVPFYPLMIIISGGFIELGWQALGESKRNGPLRFRYTIILIWLAVTVQLSVFTFKWYSEMAFLKYYSAIVEEEYKPVAVFLKDNLREDATLISYMDAGAIPYYSGLRVIDFGRLNDLYLARKQPDLEKIVDYFFIQYADAVVMTSESEENYLYIDEAITIYNDPRFADFELAKVFGNSVNYPYAQWVFLRKGK
ncbi:MAG TPA: hypothetical protein ENJ82_13595 [Bacteroidetes bacterium]|nr:hypothetical protein [Bacteroidota bacterium]